MIPHGCVLSIICFKFHLSLFSFVFGVINKLVMYNPLHHDVSE